MLEKHLLNKKLVIILTDITINQNIQKEHSSHIDGSAHDFDTVMTIDAFVEKCIICGYVKQREVKS